MLKKLLGSAFLVLALILIIKYYTPVLALILFLALLGNNLEQSKKD
jgi:hypothetical protein